MMLAKGHVMYYSDASCTGNVPVTHCVPMNSKSNNRNAQWFEHDINGPRIMKSILKYCLIVLII